MVPRAFVRQYAVSQQIDEANVRAQIASSAPVPDPLMRCA